MRNQEEIKIELQKKVHKRICVRDITFLTARPPFYVIFCCFLRLLPPLPQLTQVAEWPLYRCMILVWVVFCVMISWVNGQKSEKCFQFNNRWLGSLRTWYYFRFCFSFSCSGYDLTLIKKSHTSNCYSFLQKFLLKTKTYKLVAGNYGSSIYCQNSKFRKSYLHFVTYILFNKETKISHVIDM